ncbi:HbrB-like-domain-containing protein [Fomes fomentarius]|nr:HbrB-like-domain-containing protein [Fomes fomentarius]
MAPAAAPSINSTLSAESPWTSLHVLVLPLFNGEPLRYPIEELNQLVRRHIQTVVSAAPGKALATLEHDSIELISNGMVTLNSKLTDTDDDRIIPRIVELWMFFWGQVLPYLEGSLLPLQTDPILSTLYRTPKTHRPSSPTAAQNAKGSGLHFQSAATTTNKIDVRALALVSFRDRVILPLFPRLYARLTMSKDEVQNVVGPESMQARLQQMLLVLVSQRSHRPASLSLTAPPPQPSTGEAAITRLLRALHAPIATLGAPRHAGRTGAAPSFLSAGLPRDRRGRIAQKADVGSPRANGRRWKARSELDDAYGVLGGGGYAEEIAAGSYGGGYVDRYGGAGDWEDADTDTPRVGVTFADPVRARDKELLESLRSPDPENTTRMSMGGWGLGAGREEQAEIDMGDDDEMDSEDFDHALVRFSSLPAWGLALTARRRWSRTWSGLDPHRRRRRRDKVGRPVSAR